MPELQVDRSSVCMADDVVPHASQIAPAKLTLRSIVAATINSRYLPMPATWIMRANDRSGIPLAVLGLQFRPPQRHFLGAAPDTPLAELTGTEDCSVFYEYFLEVSPQLVVDAITAGAPLPDRWTH